MSALDRKMLRDLWHVKGQVLAIALVLAAGVATCVMSLSTLQSLDRSKETYYQRYRFAHVFGHVKRAPRTLATRLEAIPGVAQVETRIVADVTLNVPEMAEPCVGRLISVPDLGEPRLNHLHLRRGRQIAPGHHDEVLVGESFAVARQLVPGDSLLAIINGRQQRLKIVGIVLSPEYILQIQGTVLLPDDKRFGVFWMSYSGLAEAFNMEGAFNDVSLTLMRGASEAEVIKRVDDLTESYGAIGAFGRSDQVSHRYISDEIRQLRTMGIVGPAIFISVATFLLNVVISRLINTQREEIAALKAFGYTKREIRWHYLKMVILIPLVGVLLGTAVGGWMGRGLTQMYTRFYRFPVIHFEMELSVVLLALVGSIVVSVLGSWAAVRRAVILPPAEAMRPEPPANYHPTVVERLGLGRLLPHTLRMILRQLERHPIKAMLSCVGIAMGVAVLILGSFTLDAVNYIMDFQFRLAQTNDMMLTFVEPTSSRVLSELRHLPGVLEMTAFRSAPARLRYGHRHRRVGILGLEPGNELFRVVDDQERIVPLPPDGLLLSSKLAELLGARVGDMLIVEVMEGERPVRQIPITGIITEYGGTNAYMSVYALQRTLHEGRNYSGAFLSVEEQSLNALYERLKNTPRVARVNLKKAALQSFEETIAENLLRIRTFNIGFASIIAFGVVYNSARISLAERSRELATLRVIGFTRTEISVILLGELAVLTSLAIPIGFAMGYGFAGLMTLGLDTELYRIPLVVRQSTFGFAALVIILAALFSGLVVRRRLDHLDLVAVLKSKE